MSNSQYSVGKKPSTWREGKAQTITFIVTDDCNLRCKYCYITHKSAEKRMSLDTAKRFIDYILSSDINFAEAVILDFIGGEPMLEAELIGQICDYFKVRAFECQHPWYWNYRINICTNGVNYSSPAVQKLINDNNGKMSVTITLDGCKEKHDMQRVFPDGSGSFDIIDKNIDLWMTQALPGTKVTFASDDLPLLKDSIVSLWKRGITKVAANVVFEDVWKEEDDKIFEDQLIQLADYIIDNHLFDSGNICTLFDEIIGFPNQGDSLDGTYCGAGKMMALSADGDIYPCLRYYGHSLNHHEDWPIGNIDTGIDMEKIRPFVAASLRLQSDEECINCEVATGCAMCQGFCYDEAETPTNFHRAKYICKMHKARVRANDYYFARLKNEFGISREHSGQPRKSLYILASADYVSHCSYHNYQTESDAERITPDTLMDSLRYARETFARPILVHPRQGLYGQLPQQARGYDILHILPAEQAEEAKELGYHDILPVFSGDEVNVSGQYPSVILTVSQTDLAELFNIVQRVYESTERINLFITDLDSTFDDELYREQLNRIADFIIAQAEKNIESFKELSLLTDICFMDQHEGCGAGAECLTAGVDGALHICPAFFSGHGDLSIGSVYAGVTRKYSERLYHWENKPICGTCDAYQCTNCAWIDLGTTKEVNVSPSFQCRKSHVERSVSVRLYEWLKTSPLSGALRSKPLVELNYRDPITNILGESLGSRGYYRYKE